MHQSQSRLSAMRPQGKVEIVGAMRNVMREGQLQGRIRLDSLENTQNLYGIGPQAYLKGEVLLWDGKGFLATVDGNGMVVKKTLEVNPPFFVFAAVKEWEEFPLPATWLDLHHLERILDSMTASYPRPFPFRLQGKVSAAKIHVVNLPEGSVVSSPEEAHRGLLVNYEIQSSQVDVLGFFSKEHQTIFTHHDSYMHLHLITRNRKMMGHLDGLKFHGSNMRLSLPKR
jgi:acetolactate decarboxylase